MAGFGERISQLREAKRLTQHDLASRLRTRGFGTTQTTVSRWESGQMPRMSVLRALADELGVTVEQLYGDEEDSEAAPMTPLVADNFADMLRAEIRAAVRISVEQLYGDEEDSEAAPMTPLVADNFADMLRAEIRAAVREEVRSA